MTENVLFRRGTRAKYDALEVKSQNTLYFLTDTLEFYLGDKWMGTGRNATTSVAGLLNATDKAALDALADSGLLDLRPVDASIVIEKVGDDLTVGVAVSEDEGNLLELKADGLYARAPEDIDVPEYTMERQAEAEGNAFATYKLKKTLDGVSTYVGDPINIPRDLVLNGGELKVVETADVPYTGAQVGDPYIDLVLNDAGATHIYIPVKGLVDIYTAGDGITIVNNVVSVTNRTVEVLEGPNGTARIWNETDGGGVQFTHTDGTRSFTGVNDGGKSGITGQLYSVDTKNGNLGTRINMTTDGFFYFKGKTSALAYTADDEIATKGDIADATLVWNEL